MCISTSLYRSEFERERSVEAAQNEPLRLDLHARSSRAEGEVSEELIVNPILGQNSRILPARRSYEIYLLYSYTSTRFTCFTRARVRVLKHKALPPCCALLLLFVNAILGLDLESSAAFQRLLPTPRARLTPESSLNKALIEPS